MDTNQHEWEGLGRSFNAGGSESPAGGLAQTAAKSEQPRPSLVSIRVHSWLEKVVLGFDAA